MTIFKILCDIVKYVLFVIAHNGLSNILKSTSEWFILCCADRGYSYQGNKRQMPDEVSKFQLFLILCMYFAIGPKMGPIPPIFKPHFPILAPRLPKLRTSLLLFQQQDHLFLFCYQILFINNLFLMLQLFMLNANTDQNVYNPIFRVGG